ncbi:ROK family transcriptional regulator [Oceanobacillus manasiensis]|uniref:ROK family transcriptional regulator n=1 Tax=Oceanobacillus manasiensis TaxID=586413 RepID=UPI0005AAD58B|nr:ROK family protein [Oceanobacillus manasiensis]
MKTGDQTLVKQINKSIVLSTIEKKSPISRAQISKETGLNKATVSNLVSDLIADELVNELGQGQSSGGRKPVMLYFNTHAGYAIGLDLGVNYILAVLTELSGEIVEEISVPLSGKDAEHVIQTLSSLVSTLIGKAPQSPYGVVGIGIGAPGIVDPEGHILFTPYLELSEVNLKQILEEKFNIPTVIDNEANTGALGEHLYGAGKNAINLIYVSVGIGIGTGIIMNGQLYKGATGISGEMGHLTIEVNGRKCSCGNRGCWELYASESALLKEAKKMELFKKDDSITLESIESEAKKGNKDVLRLLHSIGEYNGIGLANIINTFNPDMLIIGNRMARFENWITNPIKSVLDERLSSFHRNSVNLKISSLGKYSNALGASAIVSSRFLDINRVEVI